MSKDDLLKITYPLDTNLLLRKQRGLRRKLREYLTGESYRIAILGGSTTSEIRNFIELFMLDEGILPEFYESEYNKFFEDAVFQNEKLDTFNPQFIYIHTSSMNIINWPHPFDKTEAVEQQVEEIYSYYEQVWLALEKKYDASILQNNFEAPFIRPLGNFDATASSGRSQFVIKLNERFALRAQKHPNFLIHDLNYLAAWLGLERWYDRRQWHAYKQAMSMEALPMLGQSITAQIRATLGKSKKCLVCDLDNTLWGGVIGDDGVEGINIGNETPEAEAYLEIQKYIRDLRERGIILAVSSKNDEGNAKAGLEHPDSLLSFDDFTAFQANWLSKDHNIETIAKTINIGTESLVFLDDNPVERQLISDNCHKVSVPNIGEDITRYIAILDKAGYFDVTQLSNEDSQRAKMYQDNIKRQTEQYHFNDYSHFLRSLNMEAEINSFQALYLPRIAQLTNKTNQFNLTTKRFTQQELEAFNEADNYLTLYGRLRDKYGDNGLVSVILGRKQDTELHIDLWLMSCRVISRDFERAMFLKLQQNAIENNCKTIRGYYIPSKKNSMVVDHYSSLGFSLTLQSNSGESQWHYHINKVDKEHEIPITIYDIFPNKPKES